MEQDPIDRDSEEQEEGKKTIRLHNIILETNQSTWPTKEIKEHQVLKISTPQVLVYLYKLERTFKHLKLIYISKLKCLGIEVYINSMED